MSLRLLKYIAKQEKCDDSLEAMSIEKIANARSEWDKGFSAPNGFYRQKQRIGPLLDELREEGLITYRISLGWPINLTEKGKKVSKILLEEKKSIKGCSG